MMHRPAGPNADEWALFLDEHAGAVNYLAVQIAEAIECAERQACERAIDRMGWPEIQSFNEELHRGQGIREDAGGYFLRTIKALFGVKPKDPVVTYKDAARALLEKAAEEGRS